MKNQPDKSAGKTSSEPPLALNLLRGRRRRRGRRRGVAKSCVKSCRKATKYIYIYIVYRYKFADMRVALCAIFAFLPGIKFNKAFIARVEEGRRGKATMDKVYEACITSKSITPSSLLHYY